MTKLIMRFFLWLLGVALPTFIAACYGVPYRYSKSGRVTERETGQGINGIAVTCFRDGAPHSSARSYEVTYPSGHTSAGYFELEYDQPCDEVRFADTDGSSNGGQYATKSVKFCETCAALDVELEHAN